jgi:hypothetical protein
MSTLPRKPASNSKPVSNSTPHRQSSATKVPQTSTRTKRKQEELKEVMRGEIGGQTWQFPTDTFIQMLSPRTPKSPETVKPKPQRSDFYYEVDKPYFQSACNEAMDKFKRLYSLNLKRTDPKDGIILWPKNKGEKVYYEPFSCLLNDCVKIGHATLDKYPNAAPERSKRYHANLRFVAYDRPTGDGIEGAASLKPDIFGGTNTDEKSLKGTPGEHAWWSPQDGTDRNKVSYPGEIKDKWSELIEQAATYARCLFDASPTRAFALVLAFNHKTSEARILMFHRSGLTSSDSLKLTTLGGKRDLLKITLTLLLWTTPAHAGFAPSCNGVEWMLPSSKEDESGTKWVIDASLHHSVCVRGRATHVSRVCRPQNHVAVQDTPVRPPPSDDKSLAPPAENQARPDAPRRSTRPRTQTNKALPQPSQAKEADKAKAKEEGIFTLLRSCAGTDFNASS